MLPRHHRLRSSRDFSAAVRRGPRSQRGARVGTPLLVVHRGPIERGSSEPVRVGFVVSRAVGSAVVRNRVARRLRALISERLSLIDPGTDLVIRALPAAAHASSLELSSSLDEALTRLSRRTAPS